MASVRRLLWIGALAAIVYLLWRWRRQDEVLGLPNGNLAASAPSLPPSTPQPAAPAPSTGSPAPTAGAPRRIPTRVHRGAPPSSAPAAQAPAPEPPEEPDDPTPAALAMAVGADAPLVDAEPPVPEQPADPTDLAPLVGPEAAELPVPAEQPADPADLASLVGPAAAGNSVDLASLVGPDAAEPTPIVGLTNLNSAGLDALIALPGIGPALARRIIAYREQHGPYTSIEQLIDIQGIGPRNIDEFRHLVTV